MTTDVTIQKVKITKDRVTIKSVKHYVPDIEKNEEFEPKYETNICESEVKPHRDFYAAFSDLKLHALVICELTKTPGKATEKEMDNFTMSGVSIHEDKGDIKIVLTGVKYLSNGQCITINSPNVDVEEVKGLNGEIKNLIKKAKAFLTGKNGEEQLSLFEMKVAS